MGSSSYFRRRLVAGAILLAVIGGGLWLYLATRPLSCEEWQKRAQEFERTGIGPLVTDGLGKGSGPVYTEEDSERALERLGELLNSRPENCGDPPLGV